MAQRSNRNRFSRQLKKLYTLVPAMRSLRLRIFLLTVLVGTACCFLMERGMVRSIRRFAEANMAAGPETEMLIAYAKRHGLLRAAILVLITVLIAFFVSSALVFPITRLTKIILDIKSGYTNQRIRGTEYLETDQIVDSFNQVVERMRMVDDSRQEFVTNVSHELKTPMTSMKVLADSLLADPETPAETYREFLTDIDQEIDRENRIIEELLNLSRLDSRKSPMNISQVNVNALLETILKNIRPLAMKRHIELLLISECDVIAEADEIKLGMIFRNLVDNAVKYNVENGKVIVTVNADHKNFTVSVEDTGIGIPEESAGMIYDRFYRVDKSRSRQIGGSGLGLSIARSAVLLHRGTISLESIPDVGSTFTVTIPLVYTKG